jgi:hypothetical protein
MDPGQDGNANNNNNKKRMYFNFAQQAISLIFDDSVDDSAAAAAVGSAALEVIRGVAAEEEDSDSSEGDETAQVWGGRPGKAPNKNRHFVGAHRRLVEQYLSGRDSVYNENDFERRHRMPRAVFMRIHEALVGAAVHPFVQSYNAATKAPGIHPLCRLVACLRKLSYGDGNLQ